MALNDLLNALRTDKDTVNAFRADPVTTITDFHLLGIEILELLPRLRDAVPRDSTFGDTDAIMKLLDHVAKLGPQGFPERSDHGD